jgi:hypothetical protein
MFTINLPKMNPQVTQFSFFTVLMMSLYIPSYIFSIENCFGSKTTNATEPDRSSSIDPAILGGIFGGLLAVAAFFFATPPAIRRWMAGLISPRIPAN